MIDAPRLVRICVLVPIIILYSRMLVERWRDLKKREADRERRERDAATEQPTKGD